MKGSTFLDRCFGLHLVLKKKKTLRIRVLGDLPYFSAYMLTSERYTTKSFVLVRQWVSCNFTLSFRNSDVNTFKIVIPNLAKGLW